ncbi:MAG: hypothetical protein AAGF97_05795 [Planctomycetota bacterium]
MSRRTKRRDESAVSLLPFLAVLICTMGALIVLLVVLVRQAGEPEPVMASAEPLPTEEATPPPAATPVLEPAVPAADVDPGATEGTTIDALAEHVPPATEPPGPSLEELEAELADARQEAEALAQARESHLRVLREGQLTLSRVEDQTRKLADRFHELQAEAKRIAAASMDELSDQSLETQIDSMQAALATANEQLDQARAEVAEDRKKYAIVAYDGPNGTERRPIYVECLADRVILYPEEIVFFHSDFPQGMGPDNPLAVALRFVREYHLDQRTSTSAADAYPLLLVRPAGAASYGRCRRALSGWDDEFGYELIPDDMALTFPEPDPALALQLHQIVEQARQLQQRTAARQPERSGGLVLSANSQRGGFVTPEGRAAGDLARDGGGRGHGTRPGGSTGASGTAGRAGSGPGGHSTWPNSGTTVGVNNGSGNGTGYGGTGYGGTRDGGTGYPKGPGSGGGGSGTSSGGAGGPEGPPGGGQAAGFPPHGGPGGQGGLYGTHPSVGTGSAPSGSGGSGGQGGSGYGGEAQGGDGQPGTSPPGTGQGQGGGEGSLYGGSPHGTSTTPGQGTGAGNGGTNGGGGGGGSAAGGGANGGGMGAASGGGGVSGQASSDGNPSGGSAAMSFGGGANWGLPNATSGAIGITRPIYLVCSHEAVSFERGAAGSIPVPFRGPTGSAIQPFIEQVWQQIEGWGIAGSGVYWKPILKVKVAPGGETRFEEFAQLLRGSGLEIVRR